MSIISILRQFKIRDLLAQYGAAAVVAVISFVLTALIARKIGPELFGLYATALSVGSILGIFLDFGFKQIIQREAARPDLSYSFRQLQGASIWNIVWIVVIFLVGSALLYGTHILLTFAIALCFAGLALTQLISSGLRGQKHFVQDAFHQIASRAISAVAILLALLFWPDIAVIIGAWGFGTIAWALYAFSTFSRPEAGAYSLAIYRHAAPLFVIDLIIVIHFRIDLIAMQVFDVDQPFIGNFSAALRIVELFIFFTFPIRSILLTQIRQESSQVFYANLLVRCLLAAAMAVVVSVAVAFLAPTIITAAFGDGYGQAVSLLRVMVWLLVPSFVLAIIFEASIGANKEDAYRTAAFVALILNVVSLALIILWDSYPLIAPQKVFLEVVFCVLAFALLLYRQKKTK